MSGPGALRAAGAALQHWQRRQEVNAHNLANVETTGFKAHRVFSSMVAGGVPTVGTMVDRRPGALRETGAPLDLGLAGDGFFVVRGAGSAGDEYVRSGSFALDGDGRVVDERGRALLAEEGELILPPGPIRIDGAGTVMVGDDVVARLRIESGPVSVDASGRLVGAGPVPEGRQGGEPIAASAIVGGGPPEAAVIRQGYLEDSNVGVLEALVEMTTIQRAFQSVQGSLRVLDETLETAVNRLGRVG